MLIHFRCCQPELGWNWHIGDEAICLSWAILHVELPMYACPWRYIYTHLYALKNSEAAVCRKTENNETEWYKVEKKDKASQPTALPLQDARCWTWLSLSPLIRLFVHLLSRALARQCSDWIARFFLACCSSCWCFHLLPTPPSCQNVWLRKRTDNGRCRKTRCIGFAFWVSQRAISIPYMPHPGFYSLRCFCYFYY